MNAFTRIGSVVRATRLRRLVVLTAATGVFAPIASAFAAPGDAPILVSAVSRKVHGASGTFDLRWR